MCGIVGAVGHKQCSSVLLDALKRLEYRGYDSSGLVTIDDGKITLKRAVGKLINLDAILLKAPLMGDIGIGHTRWATHGGCRRRTRTRLWRLIGFRLCIMASSKITE